jgi:signal peptidase II
VTDDTRRILAVAAGVLVVDGATKLLTVTRLEDAPVDLGWVVLRSARNTGISFSIGAGSSPLLVTGVTLLATIAIVVLAARGAIHPPLAAGLLVGGGLGNLIDRIGDGAVVDMVDLGWFPVFNAADVALNVGVAVVLVWGLVHGDPEARPDEDTAPSSPLDTTAGVAPVDPAGSATDDDSDRADDAGPPTERADAGET